MSELNVSEISGLNNEPVYFETGIEGDGNFLSFLPEILTVTPAAGVNNVDVTGNINIQFDQEIKFSSTPGTLNLRSGSKTGSVIESFTTGSSSGLSISNDTLTINPTSSLPFGTKIYVDIPSVGIANTFGGVFVGNNNYQFTTQFEPLNATGGNHEFTNFSTPSPTNYYKYHIFTGTGNLTMNAPSASNPDFYVMVVGGGGAGGGGYSPSYAGGGGGGAGGVRRGNPSTINPIPSGTYVVTIGGGGTNQSPSAASLSGSPSSIGSLISSFGGGGGGGYPTESRPGKFGGSGGGGWGGPSPSTEPQYAPVNYRGHVSQWPGGTGVPGQGNPGGSGTVAYNPNYSWYYAGGGGGGASNSSGQGGTGPYPTYPGNSWPSYPNSPVWNVYGGSGGYGVPVPEFPGPVIGPQSPTIPTESRNLLGTYGGGGGGGAPSTSPFATAGNGGPGGGGHGAYVRPGGPAPSPFPQTSGSNYIAENGFACLGGGGGGGTSPSPSTYTTGRGGSGVVMIRYAIPSTLAN